jgi:putative sigma-54 modulation protein
MKLTVTGRHVVVTEAARSDIALKLGKLERVLNDGVVSAQCVVGRERGAFVCELTVHARGDHMLRGTGRGARLPNAVAGAVEKVGQQANRLADRWKTRKRATAPARGVATSPDEAPRPTPRVIRSREYAVKPMSLEDAVLELSTGARAFLVFRQAASERVAVLFRRPDGHFGLIEPEA